MSKIILTPGEKSPVSAQISHYNPKTGTISNTEAVVSKGEIVPPTPKPGIKWIVVDLTKHKRK